MMYLNDRDGKPIITSSKLINNEILFSPSSWLLLFLNGTAYLANKKNIRGQ